MRWRLKFRGGTKRALVNSVFVPCQKGAVLTKTVKMTYSGWTFRIFFIFFSARGRGRESKAPGGGGDDFFIENPRREGLPGGWGWRGEGPGRVFAGNFGPGGGG